MAAPPGGTSVGAWARRRVSSATGAEPVPATLIGGTTLALAELRPRPGRLVRVPCGERPLT
jgi:hypothetical protein